MSVHAQFLHFRGKVHIWCWPLLIFELWCLSAWAGEEACARGADLDLLIAADKWGRVHLLFLSDKSGQPSGLERLSPFILPGSLALDSACAVELNAAQVVFAVLRAFGCANCWETLRALPVAPDTS